MITIHLDESNNAAGEVVTEAIAALGIGALDATGLVPVTTPIAPGSNTFEKWLRWHVTDLSGFSAVRGLKVWAEPVQAALYFNGSEDQTTYESANHRQTVFAAPARTATRTPEGLPTVEPAEPNLGIGGSLAGSLGAPGRSDYLLLQVRAAASAPDLDDAVRVTFAYEAQA